VTQAFLLKHADPTQVDTVIKPFLTQPGANSVAIKDPSVLIVTDYAPNVIKIAKLVRLMDEPKADVGLEIVGVRNMEASALSQQLSSLLSARAKRQRQPGRSRLRRAHQSVDGHWHARAGRRGPCSRRFA
jgi:type II secretory pathway component GspD/PulD (secretin)